MAVVLKNDWNEILKDEFQKEYYLKLRKFLVAEYSSKTIYPDCNDIFNALHYTSFKDVKVVILGQDPYHGPNQAHGLSFSVQPGITPPPSLKNIYKELKADLNIDAPDHGYLKKWAQEGVLLLNTVLTVQASNPNSHKNMGWENLTDHIISCIDKKSDPVVFILWGRNAQMKKSLIRDKRHLIIESPHPSPFSANRGFFGSRPFSRTNEFLVSNNLKPIDWSL